MARILTITLNPALDLTVRLRQLELGAVNRSEAVLTQAAGKGLNVAQVLADLGHRLTVSGFLGEDNQPPFTAMFQRRGFADAPLSYHVILIFYLRILQHCIFVSSLPQPSNL